MCAQPLAYAILVYTVSMSLCGPVESGCDQCSESISVEFCPWNRNCTSLVQTYMREATSINNDISSCCCLFSDEPVSV